MVHRTYLGLGSAESAVREFEHLAEHARQLLALKSECAPRSAEALAIDLALDALETAAYHFTRRRHFYGALRSAAEPAGPIGRLAERDGAATAFKALTPYVSRLRELQQRCRPFGRDYLALEIAKHGLETAAYHFTRIGGFYGLQPATDASERRE